ncbi:hypothetical protein F4677DRAFT_151367 [Hypoxylon crocopeplum]|nr:hypothetical protein F4677DRAFT_151367 [Hypoxylon crocopeplum]
MAIEWDMAAFAAALAIFVVPYIVKVVKAIYGTLRSKQRRYVRLQWQDIPQGRVHQCSSQGTWYSSCFHSRAPHQQDKECWKSSTSLGSCFNRTWDISTKNPRYAKLVPEALPLGSQFLCTDARTVLAFALCTAGKRKSSDWHSKTLSFDDTRIECETLNGNTTMVHIRGSFQSERCQLLTKAELERMLSGFPPWYRETVTTRAKIELPFPISSERDVPRGGWIIAVGLMDLDLDRQKPLALYRCPDEPDEPTFRQNGRMFRQAVARCRDHIRGNIAPHFPGNQDVADAIKALDWLVDQFTGSGMPEGRIGRGPDHSSRTLPHMRYSDCKFVCDNFNEYRELDAAAKARLQPILFPAVSAAVHGAYEVVQYLKDTGMELKVSPELLPLDRDVWLRDCVTVLPIK